MKLIKLFENNIYSDKRGVLIELKSGVIKSNMKHMFISYTRPDTSIVRGNHYHNYKNEWFYIIQGTIKVQVKDLKTGKEEDYTFDDTLKKFIYIKPRLVHKFHNIGKNELIFLAIVDRKFNQKKPDTYSYKI